MNFLWRYKISGCLWIISVSRKTFTSGAVSQNLEMESLFPVSQPASHSNISFLWRVHFPAHGSICPIRLVKLRGTIDFNVPRDNIKYPERLRPVSISTVYLYFELESYDLCYARDVMLLVAADPSSYNLFSGVIRSFCFIIE